CASCRTFRARSVNLSKRSAMLMFHPVPERNQQPMPTEREQCVLERLSDYEYSAVRCVSQQFQFSEGFLKDKTTLAGRVRAVVRRRPGVVSQKIERRQPASNQEVAARRRASSARGRGRCRWPLR